MSEITETAAVELVEEASTVNPKVVVAVAVAAVAVGAGVILYRRFKKDKTDEVVVDGVFEVEK